MEQQILAREGFKCRRQFINDRKPQINGSLKVTKAIETDNSIVAKNAQIAGIAIGKSPSSQFLTINSKLKTFNENSVLDDVVRRHGISRISLSGGMMIRSITF